MSIFSEGITNGIINRKTGSIFSYSGWPSVCKDENGTLYAVASSMRLGHICPFGKTAMYISRNNGKTWTKPIIINDSYLDDRDVGILYLGNGRLLVTFFSLPAQRYATGAENEAGRVLLNNPLKSAVAQSLIDTYETLTTEEAHGGSFVMISEDYGVTWCDPIRVPITAPHGPCLRKNGTIVYIGMEMNSDGELPENSIATYQSCDGGHTWERLAILDNPTPRNPIERYCEPHIVELPNGDLLAGIRAEGAGYYDTVDVEDPYPLLEPSGKKARGFSIYTCISKDGGKTWSEWTPSGINGAPPHFMMHSSGALICSYGRRNAPYGARASVSYDMGKTWEDEYVVFTYNYADGDGGCHYWDDLGYACSVELDDKSILTVYYAPYSTDVNRSFLYSIWKLKEK